MCILEIAHFEPLSLGAVTTSMAPQLVMVSPDMAVVRGMGWHWLPWVELAATELLLSDKAGYRVQLMGRLRSDFKEFCKALEDIGNVDGSSLL